MWILEGWPWIHKIILSWDIHYIEEDWRSAWCNMHSDHTKDHHEPKGGEVRWWEGDEKKKEDFHRHQQLQQHHDHPLDHKVWIRKTERRGKMMRKGPDMVIRSLISSQLLSTEGKKWKRWKNETHVMSLFDFLLLKNVENIRLQFSLDVCWCWME